MVLLTSSKRSISIPTMYILSTALPFTLLTLISPTCHLASAFQSPFFVAPTSEATKVPTKTKGVEIEMPNFDELFANIQKLSPLAKLAIESKEGGFASIDDHKSDHKLNWKTLENSKPGQKPIHQIHKIDNFLNLGCPLLRFRSSLEGPCIGERFANFIMSLDERKKWDGQIADVNGLYQVYDTDVANILTNFKYGECSNLGVGYCATKSNLVSSAREQLTMCGIQDFANGSCIIWGTEMEDRHNHLLPRGERKERARSHLFATTLMPTGPNSFDAEYVLQLDCGGNIPSFLTTPVIVDTVKSLFHHAKKYFVGGDGSDLSSYITAQAKQQLDSMHNLFAEKKGILFAT
mmetsp:Transcript_12944/g.18558  ORF Transcript_12944/g.18558 Transcript_12944/m.18558 type:complete len:349 (-) Transcript_12944:93-1139(-)